MKYCRIWCSNTTRSRARDLSLRHVPTRAWAITDPALLRRVLQNFIANALRYTTQGGVLIGVRWRVGTWAVEVWDTGPGIAEAHRELIFEEFERVADIAAGDERGLGLGLSICQRIARGLNHPLHLRSREGRGSVFGLLLPRVEASSTPRSTASVEPSKDALSAQRVLCVDDDADIRDALRSLLGKWGCQVDCVGTAAEALARTSGEAPTRIILDFHLHGGLDGIDLALRLREAWGPRPILLLTAEGSEATRQRAREAKITLLNKPIRPAALRAWLASP